MNKEISFIIGLMLNLLMGMSFMLAGMLLVSFGRIGFWSIWCIIIGQISVYTLIRFVKNKTLKEAGK